MKKILKKKNIIKLIFLILLLVGIVGYYIGDNVIQLKELEQYDKTILPGVFVEDFDLSSYSFKDSRERLEYYRDYILSKKVVLMIDSKPYEKKIKELGIDVDIDKTIEQVKNYQKKIGNREKMKLANYQSVIQFPFIYKLENQKIENSLNEIKGNVDRNVVNGYFDTSEGVKYNKGVSGYYLNVGEDLKIINETFSKKVKSNQVIDMVGESIAPSGNDSFESIDTLTSSYVTEFIPNTYLRNINLNTALNYINGTVVEPGETFSYCSKAGPFNKSGYVFYYEFVGNGVCQIATTTYNAALLGGLEILKRYPHEKRSAYVPGGLDATVASYAGGWCVDMAFRNTYQYPIYIKAYSVDGYAHVEFWSNHDAKGGYEYQTSSVRIGNIGYRSYLHKYKDGQEVDVQLIATTWYKEE